MTKCFMDGFYKQANILGAVKAKLTDPLVRAAKRYHAEATSPGFRLRRAAGLGILGGGATMYGIQKATEPQPLNLRNAQPI